MNDFGNYRHRVMYYETDKMGITHHSNYIRFMEEARVDFLEKLGWPYERLEDLGIGSPVIGIECRFHCPTTFADTVEITVCVKEYNGVRLKVGYKMTNQNGDTVCEGFSEHCFVNCDGRPVRLKKVCPEFDLCLKQISKINE